MKRGVKSPISALIIALGQHMWRQLTGRNPSVLVLDIWRQCDGCTYVRSTHHRHKTTLCTDPHSGLQAKQKQHRHCPATKHACLARRAPANCGDGCILYRLGIQTDCEHLKKHGKLPMARQWSCLGALFASNKVRTAMRQSSYLFWKQELWWKLSSCDVGLFMRTVGPFLDPFLNPCLFCMTCCGQLLQAWAMQEADCTWACLRLENSPSLSFSIVLKKAYQAVPILAHT